MGQRSDGVVSAFTFEFSLLALCISYRRRWWSILILIRVGLVRGVRGGIGGLVDGRGPRHLVQLDLERFAASQIKKSSVTCCL